VADREQQALHNLVGEVPCSPDRESSLVGAARVVSDLADSDVFVLSAVGINEDVDARTLAEYLIRQGWPGDTNVALRRLERKLAAAIRLLGDDRG
jgi:hypothetical protein